MSAAFCFALHTDVERILQESICLEAYVQETYKNLQANMIMELPPLSGNVNQLQDQKGLSSVKWVT